MNEIVLVGVLLMMIIVNIIQNLTLQRALKDEKERCDLFKTTIETTNQVIQFHTDWFKLYLESTSDNDVEEEDEV